MSTLALLLTQFVNALSQSALLFFLGVGLTLIFGLMRITNLCHGGLYLVGGYLGFTVLVASGNFWLALLVAGVAVALLAAFANLDVFVELTNIGTLFAFILVCAAVIILRRREPNRPRPFRTPLVPWVPLFGIAVCLYLMLNLPAATWIRFGIWLLIGVVIYFAYGYKRSRLAQKSTVDS